MSNYILYLYSKSFTNDLKNSFIGIINLKVAFSFYSFRENEHLIFQLIGWQWMFSAHLCT